VFQFRKIEIKELPANPSPPPAKAPFTPEEAKQLQEAWAKHLGVPVEFENSLGMKFRLIPPGEFSMGSTKEERRVVQEQLTQDWHKSFVRLETEPHTVRINNAFYLATTELTVGQFRQFIKATDYKTSAEKDGGGRMDDQTGVIERRPEWTWQHASFAP
jgi:formylglycine-generating enzyme required for sulfatase activity